METLFIIGTIAVLIILLVIIYLKKNSKNTKKNWDILEVKEESEGQEKICFKARHKTSGTETPCYATKLDLLNSAYPLNNI